MLGKVDVSGFVTPHDVFNFLYLL